MTSEQSEEITRGLIHRAVSGLTITQSKPKSYQGKLSAVNPMQAPTPKNLFAMANSHEMMVNTSNH